MEKNPTKNKKITIDDLAMMVAKGFGSVNKRFDKVEDRLGKVEKDILEVKENLGVVRMDVLGIGDRFVSKHEFSEHLLSCSSMSLGQKEKVK